MGRAVDLRKNSTAPTVAPIAMQMHRWTKPQFLVFSLLVSLVFRGRLCELGASGGPLLVVLDLLLALFVGDDESGETSLVGVLVTDLR